MLLASLDRRLATAIRLAGLGLVVLSVLTGFKHLGTSGRGLVVIVLLAAAVLSWLIWMGRPGNDQGVTIELYVMAAAGGLLVVAAPKGAASVFVFVAVIAAGLRVELARAAPVALVGMLAVAVSDLLYNGSGLGLVAYALGFMASLLGASTGRERSLRVDQAELLLAQTQRSHEEQLRAARLEESTRIAREIHDVLAHALAGLTIQLEATTSLLEQGADREAILARVRRAHELAREGLRETRRAVGALRGEDVSAPAAIEALVAEYRTTADAPAELTIDGNRARLAGPTGQAVLRVVQEALTNVRKHAPGAEVSVAVHAGERPDEEVVVLIDDRPRNGSATSAAKTMAATSAANTLAATSAANTMAATSAAKALAESGGGYGLQGMRERAQLLGGSLSAGNAAGGWRVELRLPAPAATTPATTAAATAPAATAPGVTAPTATAPGEDLAP